MSDEFPSSASQPRLQHLLELYAQLLQRVGLANEEGALLHGPTSTARVIDRAVRLRQQLDGFVRSGELDPAQRRRLFVLDERLADYLVGVPPRRTLTPQPRVPAGQSVPSRPGAAGEGRLWRHLHGGLGDPGSGGGFGRPMVYDAPNTGRPRASAWTDRRVPLMLALVVVGLTLIWLGTLRSFDLKVVLYASLAALVTCAVVLFGWRYWRLHGSYRFDSLHRAIGHWLDRRTHRR